VPVDVESEIEIARPRDAVAAYASDPDNATAWLEDIRAVYWVGSVAIGSQITFVTRLLGQELSYSYEILELVPGERFVMRTEDGPFPIETTYTWQDTAGGGTRMTLRNRAEPVGLSKVSASLAARAMRRTDRKHLRRLKAVLEAPAER
jgi:uncharacterized protein YndB with AHSA1/START domain